MKTNQKKREKYKKKQIPETFFNIRYTLMLSINGYVSTYVKILGLFWWWIQIKMLEMNVKIVR